MRPSLEERIDLACRLNHEFPLQSLKDRPALEASRLASIPAQCFQTAETNRFSRSHHANLAQLRNCNPDLTFLLFDARRRDRYMTKSWGDHPIGSLYRQARFGAMRADLFRYCVIFERGGFYLDINKVLAKPMSSFCQSSSSGSISFESNWCQLPAPPQAYQRLQHPERYVLQWCFAFAPGHPLLAAMIDNICRYAPAFEGKRFSKPSEAIRSLTGPGLFTHTVRTYFETHEGIEIQQAGIDFLDHLRYPGGCELMYLYRPHYKTARDQTILDPG